MDEEKKSLDIKQAAAMEKLADALEKLPSNMARNTSREKTHEQNAGQIAGRFMGQAIDAYGSSKGVLSLLGSIPAAGVPAQAVANQFMGSNAWQGQQVMPYKKAEEFAEAAGMAGIEMTQEQGQYVRDFYRNELGKKVTANKNLVDQQNSVLGPAVNKYMQNAAQQATETIQQYGPSFSTGAANLFGIGVPYSPRSADIQQQQDAIYRQNRYPQRIEYEGK